MTAAATVVIPAYRAADTIAACLRGLQGQDFDEPFQGIVVASGGDATASIVRRGFPRVVVLDAPGRLSPGAGRNLGVARASGPVVAFLAADCVPEGDWLRRRVEAHRSGEAVVGGFVDVPKRSTLAGWAQYFAKFWGMLRFEGARHRGRGPLLHLSYTRQILDAFGPFDESGIAGEDTAFNHALIAAGHHVWFDSAIRVRHLNSRRWRDVLIAQREQGSTTGAMCRDRAIVRYYAPSAWGGPLMPARLLGRAFRTVARHRRDLLVRFLACAPLVLIAITVRRRSFRRALRGTALPPEVDSSLRVETVAPVPSARPDVSVVVAAYNEERVIGACLDSLLAQTQARLEVVVVDDGSTDRTVEVGASRSCASSTGARPVPATSARASLAVAPSFSPMPIFAWTRPASNDSRSQSSPATRSPPTPARSGSPTPTITGALAGRCFGACPGVCTCPPASPTDGPTSGRWSAKPSCASEATTTWATART